MIPPSIFLSAQALVVAAESDDPCRQIAAFNALMNAVYEHDAHCQAITDKPDSPRQSSDWHHISYRADSIY